MNTPAHLWVSDMMIAQAPRELIEAVACLMDDRVAEKACAATFDCRRGSR